MDPRRLDAETAVDRDAPAMTDAPTCSSGKFRFGTFAEADRQAKVSRRRDSARKDHRQAYRCQACGGYHVGSSLSTRTRPVGGKRMKLIGVEE